MIPNCKGCKIELEMMYEYLGKYPNLNFAGTGFQEKGHFILVLIDENGNLVID